MLCSIKRFFFHRHLALLNKVTNFLVAKGACHGGVCKKKKKECSRPNGVRGGGKAPLLTRGNNNIVSLQFRTTGNKIGVCIEKKSRAYPFECLFLLFCVRMRITVMQVDFDALGHVFFNK